MDVNFSRSADDILMQVLGTFIDAQGMVWSDGVSQQQYADWCVKNNSQPHDIRSVSWTPTKKEIVSQLYWIPNGRLSPPGLDYLMLDIGWFFADPIQAVMILQFFLSIPPSGIIDDVTKAALGKLRLPLDDAFVSSFCDEYENYFNMVIGNHTLDGDRLRHFWPNRVNNARVNAITIIRAGGK